MHAVQSLDGRMLGLLSEPLLWCAKREVRQVVVEGVRGSLGSVGVNRFAESDCLIWDAWRCATRFASTEK
jgi:hypothetical protein